MSAVRLMRVLSRCLENGRPAKRHLPVSGPEVQRPEDGVNSSVFHRLLFASVKSISTRQRCVECPPLKSWLVICVRYLQNGGFVKRGPRIASLGAEEACVAQRRPTSTMSL